MLRSTAFCFIACLLLGCTCGSVLAADGVDLSSLKAKYQSGICSIDRATYAAYTNGIRSLMQQFRSSGNLDAFLLLQDEQKAWPSMPIVPTGQVRDKLSATVPGFRAMLAALDADRSAKLADLQRKYASLLDALLRELMLADQIEDAKRVKTEKDALLIVAQPQLERDVTAVETVTGAIGNSDRAGLDNTAPDSAVNSEVAMTEGPLVLDRFYSNRTPDGRKGVSFRFGISQLGEDSVLHALRWFKAHQDPSGSWAEADKTEPVAMAGLALLCFLAHGETPSSPEFGPTVEKAMKYLVGAQRKTGQWGRDYTHGIVTCAMAESFAMTKMPASKDAMDRGVDIIVKGQQPQGGFDYSYGKADRFDLSVAGWQFQALKAAKMAGCTHPELDEAIKRGLAFLMKQAYDPTKGGFVYSGKPGIQAKGGSTASMTGAGVFCLQLLGQPNAAEARSGLQFINSLQCKWDAMPPDDNAKLRVGRNPVYTWYYVTNAKFQRGGTHWTSWYSQLTKALIPAQIVEGPLGHWEGGDHGGTVYTTALCCLMLEAYYRYPPPSALSVR